MDDMAKRGLKNLRKRGSIYYYARRVPRDLVAIFGKEHITPISLRTSDPAVAEERWHEQQAYWDDHFKELRRQAQASTTDLLADAPASLSRLETIRLARRVGRTPALPPLTQASVEGFSSLWKADAYAGKKPLPDDEEERREATIDAERDIDALLAADEQTRDTSSAPPTSFSSATSSAPSPAKTSMNACASASGSPCWRSQNMTLPG